MKLSAKKPGDARTKEQQADAGTARKEPAETGETIGGVEVEIVTVGWTTPARPKSPVLFAHLQGTRDGEPFEGMAFSSQAQEFAHQMRAAASPEARIKDAPKLQKYDLTGRGIVLDLDEAVAREKDGKVRYNFKSFRPSGMTPDAYAEALEEMRNQQTALFQPASPAATADTDNDPEPVEKADSAPGEDDDAPTPDEMHQEEPEAASSPEMESDTPPAPSEPTQDSSDVPEAESADANARDTEPGDPDASTPDPDHENVPDDETPDAQAENAPADSTPEETDQAPTETFEASDYDENEYSEAHLGLNEAAELPSETSSDLVDQAETEPQPEPEPEEEVDDTPDEPDTDTAPEEETEPEPEPEPKKETAVEPKKKSGLKLSLGGKKSKPAEEAEPERKPAGMA